MKSHSLLSLVLFAGSVAADPLAPITPADPKKAQELVGQLASPKYREREKAAAELIRMGRAAKTALLEGKKHADPEVQSRCEQLLPQALALDLEYRLDRYMKDPEGKLSHDLPLLKTYREKIGTDENARKLFGEMLRVNGALLEMVEEEPAKLTDRVQQRYMEMYQEMFGNPLGGGFRGGYRAGALNAAELCCIMFVSAHPAYKPVQPDWMLSNLYTQPAFTTPLKDEKNGAAHRKLFFNYINSRMDDNTINQSVWMLSQHKIKEGADVIAKALKDGKATQVYTKASAMCCVGTLGTKDHVKTFEPYLDDATQVQPVFVGRGQQGEVKVKDVALAMTIHLSGKNPKDYGFVQWIVYPNNMIQYHQLGFGSDELRNAAFKKWAEDGKKPTETKDPAKK